MPSSKSFGAEHFPFDIQSLVRILILILTLIRSHTLQNETAFAPNTYCLLASLQLIIYDIDLSKHIS